MPTQAEQTKNAVDLLVDQGVIEPIDSEDVPTEAQVDKVMSVNNWIADLGGHDDAAIVVYEMDAKTNKPVYIESLGVEEMDGPMLFEKLKNEYGGGKFRIQMRADGAIRKTQTVEIKRPPKVTENNSPFGGLDLPSLVKEIRGEQKQDSTQLILDMMQRQNEQFQTMMTTMVAAMTANNNAAPAMDPIAMQSSMMATMVAMKTMVEPAQQKSPTDLILEGVRMVNEIRGDDSGGGGEANMYSVLQKAIGEFGGALGSIPGALATPPTAPLPAQPTDEYARSERVTGDGSVKSLVNQPSTDQPLGPISHEQVAQPNPQTTQLSPQMAQFQGYVDWMLTLARKNANPELYAEVIIDNLGVDVAFAWIADPQGQSMLIDNFPEIKEHLVWFKALGEAIDELTSEVDNEGDLTLQPDSNAPTQPNSGNDSVDIKPVETIEGEYLPPIDGDTERSGGNQSDVASDGEVSEPS